MKRFLFVIAAIIALSACGRDRIKVQTEYGDTVYASIDGNTRPDTLTPGTDVTLYTVTYNMFLLGGQRVPSGASEIDGHTVYTLQARIIE